MMVVVAVVVAVVVEAVAAMDMEAAVVVADIAMAA